MRLTIFFLFLFLLVPAGSLPGSPDAGFREAIRLRNTLDEERRAWERQRAVLESERRLLEQTIAEIDQAIERQAGQKSGQDQVRRELLAQQESLRDWEIDRDLTLDHLKSLLLPLPGFFPADGPLAPLPSAPDNGDAGEHLRLLLGWLSDTVDTSRRIGQFQAVANDASGQRREIEVVNFGLGQVLFTTADGSMAGYWRFARDGGQWQTEPAVASPLRHQLRQLDGRLTPAFVTQRLMEGGVDE